LINQTSNDSEQQQQYKNVLEHYRHQRHPVALETNLLLFRPVLTILLLREINTNESLNFVQRGKAFGERKKAYDGKLK